MSRAPIDCRTALAVLLDDPARHGITTLHRARVHASACPRCASAIDDPDAAGRVLATFARHQPSPSTALRVVLLLLATAQLVVASPWLFGSSLIPDRNVALAHLTRDGAFGIVIAAAGYLVAWRRRYALAAMLVGSLVFLAQFTTGLVDNRSRSVSTPFELVHLLVIGILALVAFTSADRDRAAAVAEPPPKPLRPL
jgi:uncharacterized membrane protein (UPF0136 family)